ncbi:protein SSUH2, partial [Trifolium pratense]
MEQQPLLSEQKNDLVGNQSGNWSSYQYLGRTGSAIPTGSLTGTHVSVDEIRSAAAVSSSVGYYPPVHGALVGSPEPDPTVQAPVHQGGYGGDYGGPRPEVQ